MKIPWRIACILICLSLLAIWFGFWQNGRQSDETVGVTPVDSRHLQPGSWNAISDKTKSGKTDCGSEAVEARGKSSMSDFLTETNIVNLVGALEERKGEIEAASPELICEWMTDAASQGSAMALHVMTFIIKHNAAGASVWFANPDNAKGEGRSFYKNAIVQYASSCPEEALKSLEKLPKDADIRDTVIRSAIAGQGKTDLSKAVALAKAFLNETDASNTIAYAAASAAEKDPRAAMSALSSLELSETCLNKCIANVLKSWMRTDPEAAIAELKTASTAVVGRVLMSQQAIVDLSRVDSSGVCDLLSQLPLTSECSSIIIKALPLLVGSNPSAVSEMIGKYPDGVAKHEMCAAYYGELAKTDWDGALKSISSEVGEVKLSAIKGVVQSGGANNLQSALDLVGGVEPEKQQNLLRELGRAAAYNNPESAVKILQDDSLSDRLGTDFRAQMLDHAVRNWARQDLEAARTWVEQLSAKDQLKGIQGLMTPWMKTDPVAASDWLSKQPPGPARDAGARVIVEQIKDADPDMAEQWRKSLSPPATGQK